MAGRTVVVLTRQDDVTADLVVLELARRGVPVFRFDTAEFPTKMVLAGELDGGRFTGGLRSAHRDLDLTDVGGVYYRRPTGFQFPAEMTPTDTEWSHSEATMGFGGVLCTLDAAWVNHPHAMARAEYKPYQLVEAQRVGLAPPRTLITNDPQQAREFAESIPAGVVYKPLFLPPKGANGRRLTLFTTPVTVEQCGDEGVAGTAHLFQERIEKAFEVRMTVVGDRVFAARIDTDSDTGRVDWRSDPDSLTYSRIDPPDGVRVAALALLRRLGLLYGAFDFAVDRDGRWIFFEVNPAGQWGWIPCVREPITLALADLLQEGPK